MLKWLARWILRNEPDEYLRGWHHGVEQHMHEPSSCYPYLSSRWSTKAQYWGEDE